MQASNAATRSLLANRFPEPPNPKSESLASAIAWSSSLDAEEQRDRAEELLSKGWVVRLDVGQDRRIDALAAHDHLCPMGDRTIDLFQKANQGLFRGQRT
jgi:hypothetical protein